MKTDADIQQDVLRELKWDSRVEETEIGVEVDHGIVTLTGTVSIYAKRLAAQEAAHRVHGVLDVANDIQVKLPGSLSRTDTEIARAARQALEWDVLVPAEDIQSTVTDGVVILEGTVHLGHQREDAARAVRNLAGVRRVVNNLRVSGPTLGAEDVREEIEQALERRAARTAKHVRVTVKEGTVTLSGPVHSWAEREAVLGAARFTPGVRAVDDQLRIDWYS
jgi:osmotically-inducible protein OsmY